MRFMFIGSIPHQLAENSQESLPDHDQLCDAARELGRSAAAAGHRIIIGSSSRLTIDYHIVQGVRSFCEAHPDKPAHIEIHRPENEAAIFEGMPDNLHFVPFTHHADPNSSQKWVIAHARAADEADVLITMGGGTATRVVGHLAVDKGKPVVAIPMFGGTSKELYQTLKYLYPRTGSNASMLESLVAKWGPESADQIVGLAEALHKKSLEERPHTYFISYAHEDSCMADHLETLLRRANRPVFRDEADIEAAERISTTIEALIAESDTFIAILSESYKKSSWCPLELEYAFNLRSKGKKPGRIAVLKSDDTTPPLRATDDLYLTGKERKDRKLAVYELITSEAKQI